MKDFLKMTLAVVLGLIIVSIISVMFVAGVAGSMAALGTSSHASLPKSGVLTIDLSKVAIVEQSVETVPFSAMTGREAVAKIGIWDAVQAVNIAAEDPAVKFVFLKTDGNVSGLAQLSELRKSLEKFRSSGKPVIAYMESPTTGSYYLASVSDKVFMTSYPGGMANLSGISSQMIFLKDLLDKFGVNVQLIRHGKYKSAGEMFVRNSPSAENLEQYQAMINSMWGSISSEMARSRGISTEKLNSLIDNLELNLPEDFLNAGLVDELLTGEELRTKLTSLSVVDNYKQVHKIALSDYVAAKVVPGKAHQKIAVLFADGNIVDGTEKSDVAGDRYASVIRKIRVDSTIKAVVLRVNSPGGSVLASEKIKNELDLLKESKPLIASYGSYAASGGYWISANCDKVFSDAVTLTGSIGVFSMIPDFSRTAKNVAHVGIATVSSNKHGDMYSLTKPLDADEIQYAQRNVEDIYDRFTSLVADARGMEQDAVDEIAQGRVWTGADALNIGLVDEIGTLEDAINYAAVCAGDSDLSFWNIKSYPKPISPMEEMFSMLSGVQEEDEFVLVRLYSRLSKPVTEARLPYEIKLLF